MSVRSAPLRRLITNETDALVRSQFGDVDLVPGEGGFAHEKVLTLDAVKKIAAAAEAEAKKRGATVVIVVVDDGGHLLLLERLDDTQVASVEVGIGKARTAAIFRRPSKVFEDQVRDGRVAALALPGATPLQGGVPIVYEGKVIGAIGVSGNTPQEDEDIAKVGAANAAAAIGNRCCSQGR
jgi:glc operon protein GlcG